MKRRIIALIQARTDSSRLPRKVLLEILGIPMILHQLFRIQKSKIIQQIIVVTSNDTSDDELSNVIIKNKFELFRGSKENVLKRFHDSLENFNLSNDDIIVRLTGDCPLHDHEIIDESIESFIKQDIDYLSNSVKPVYPDGFDVEVFNYKSLKIAYLEAKKESELEHVTPYIRDSGKFKLNDLEKTPIHVSWRLTVDEIQDFFLILEIFEKFNSTYFSFNEIIEFLENNNELIKINSHINRNEGYLKSLKKDELNAR